MSRIGKTMIKVEWTNADELNELIDKAKQKEQELEDVLKQINEFKPQVKCHK